MREEAIYISIGAAIRKRRKQLKYTQERLAPKVGISRATLANIEIGRQSILIHTLYRIADVLEMSPFDLLPEARRTENFDAIVALPLPDDLNLEQKRQIVRMLEGVGPDQTTQKGGANVTKTTR